MHLFSPNCRILTSWIDYCALWIRTSTIFKNLKSTGVSSGVCGAQSLLFGIELLTVVCRFCLFLLLLWFCFFFTLRCQLMFYSSLNVPLLSFTSLSISRFFLLYVYLSALSWFSKTKHRTKNQKFHIDLKLYNINTGIVIKKYLWNRIFFRYLYLHKTLFIVIIEMVELILNLCLFLNTRESSVCRGTWLSMNKRR